jgi:hypothetical protein
MRLERAHSAAFGRATPSATGRLDLRSAGPGYDPIPSVIKRSTHVRAHHRILDDRRANFPRTHGGLVQRSPHRRLGSVGEFGQLAQGQPVKVSSRHELDEFFALRRRRRPTRRTLPRVPRTDTLERFAESDDASSDS